MKKVTIPLLFLFAMLTLSGFGQFQEYVVHEVGSKKNAYILPSGDSILLYAGSSYLFENDSIDSLYQMDYGIGGYQMYFDHRDSVTEVFHNNTKNFQEMGFEYGNAYNTSQQEYYTSGSSEGCFYTTSFALFEDSLYVSLSVEDWVENPGIRLWKGVDQYNSVQLDYYEKYRENYLFIPQLWKTSDSTAIVLFEDEIGSVSIQNDQLNYKKWTDFDMDTRLVSDYTPYGKGITFLADQVLYQINFENETIDTLFKQLQDSILEYYYDGETFYSMIQNENEEYQIIADQGKGDFTIVLDYHQSQPTNLVSDLHLIVIDSKIYLSGLTEIGETPFLTISEFNEEFQENRAHMTIEKSSCIEGDPMILPWDCEMTITNSGNVPIYSFDVYHHLSAAFLFVDLHVLSFQNDTLFPGESITQEFEGGISPFNYLYVEAANHRFLEEPALFTDILIATKETKRTKAVSLYPNPVKNELIVELEDDYVSKKLELTILDSKGSHIKSFATQNRKQLTIDVFDLVSGTYWLQINDGNREFRVEKFIKQ